MMKSAQRKAATSARRALTEGARQEKSAVICSRLVKLDELAAVKTVLSYLAAWDEADMNALNTALTDRGVTVAYPVCLDKGHMEAYVPENAEALLPGAYGIKAPDPERSRLIEPTEIDAIIMPCVAFDDNRNRLGHGAGYYDRFIPRCADVKCICAAFEAQRLEHIDTDEHDIKPDIIITELALII